MAADKKKAAADSGGGTRALVFLVLALVAGAAATILIYNVIQSYKARIAEAQRPPDEADVIIAAGELYPGLQITESDIIGIKVPVKYIPDGTYSAPEIVVGAIPRERILPNEYILQTRLADGDSGVGLNALVPPGMRAVSLNLPDDRSLSGFLQPGNRVDVLVSISDNDSGELETITALQTVPVLAVNSTMLRDERAKREADKDGKPPPPPLKRVRVSPSVTLAVTPDQAEILVHAQQIGRIALTLRSDGDIAQSEAAGTNSADLLGENKPPEPAPVAAKKRAAPAPPREEGVTLSIIRGSSVTQKTYAKQP